MHRLLPLALLLVAGPAHAAPAGDPLALTDKELKALEARKPVIRDATGAKGGAITAIVDVNAPPEVTMAAVMDLPARLRDNSTITGLDVYADDRGPGVAVPHEAGAEWTLTIMGSSIRFSILYFCRPEAHVCTFSLDPSRESDIVSSTGSYRAYPRPGGTRLVYSSSTDSGRSLPRWLKRWISGQSLTSQILGFRDRAEASR